MILTKEIIKIVTQYNFRIFKNYGFKIGDEAIVPIEKWNRSSHEKVEVMCDICNSKKVIPYREYMNSFEKYNIYSCSSKCSQFKNKITKKEKYGDENYNNHQKCKNTCLEKYGVDNIFKDDLIKINIDKTKREKYGSNFELIVFKLRDVIYEKYGVDNISKYDDVKKKKIETSIRNFGVTHPAKSDKVKNQVREKMINDGKWFKIDSKEYLVYENLVKSETKKNLKFINWDGRDYYDGEFIFDNFNLNYNHPDYPTIDHKKSIRFGFENNIDYKIIGAIENLCYTKRRINSKKNKQNEKDFMKNFSHKAL